VHRVCVVAFVLLLAGCASTFPEDELRSVDRSVTVTTLRQDPAANLGRRVMLGGDILATRPMPNQTEVELLSKPLDSEDRPRRGDASDGRVIVTTPRFLDPAVYAAGRQITVIGTVTGEEERKIAELPYRYPVVAAESIKLWPREVLVPYPPPWSYYLWPYPYPYGWRYRGWGPGPYYWW
jgi:outer membrane lipoprotein